MDLYAYDLYTHTALLCTAAVLVTFCVPLRVSMRVRAGGLRRRGSGSRTALRS